MPLSQVALRRAHLQRVRGSARWLQHAPLGVEEGQDGESANSVLRYPRTSPGRCASRSLRQCCTCRKTTLVTGGISSLHQSLLRPVPTLDVGGVHFRENSPRPSQFRWSAARAIQGASVSVTFSGITSVSHVEGRGFDSRQLHDTTTYIIFIDFDDHHIWDQAWHYLH